MFQTHPVVVLFATVGCHWSSIHHLPLLKKDSEEGGFRFVVCLVKKAVER